jgi:phage I-like protein
MSDLCLATCDRAFTPDGTVPEWVHLFPAGRKMTRDGRQFELPDPQALMRDFQSRGVDLPIDYEHQNDRPVTNGPVPAAGWIKELRAEESGLWGRVEWTATAREMIARREYRYLSPSFLFNRLTRQVSRLKGAGLVHNPNLYLTAFASEELDMAAPDKNDTAPKSSAKEAPAELLPKLAEALGMSPESDAAAILTTLLAALTSGKVKAPKRLNSDRPNPARFVPIGAVQDLLADRNGRIATMREEEASRKMEWAFREGYITPAMREWATALCMEDPASFDTFLAKSPAPWAHLTRPIPHIEITPRGSAVIGEEAAICAQLGLKPGSLAD